MVRGGPEQRFASETASERCRPLGAVPFDPVLLGVVHLVSQKHWGSIYRPLGPMHVLDRSALFRPMLLTSNVSSF